MKKSLRVAGFLLACLMACAFVPGAALASTGPQPAQYNRHGCWRDGGCVFLGKGYLYGDIGYQGDYTVYTVKPGEKIEGFPGVSYSKKTNTLTLDGVNTADYLFVHCMGDDFKIRVLGANALGQVYVNNSGEREYSGAVEFTGTGSLTLNSKRFYDSAISVDYGKNARIVVGKNVSMKLYDDRGQYGRYGQGVVCVNGTKVARASSAIQFRGVATRPEMKTTRSYGGYMHEVVAGVFLQGEVVAPAEKSLVSLSVGDGRKTRRCVISCGKVTARKLAAAAKDPAKTRTVVLGAKVKKIGKGAFAKLKGMRTLEVRSTKLTRQSVRGAFKGSKVRKLTVKVPASRRAAYQKVFTAKNLGVKKVAVTVR